MKTISESSLIAAAALSVTGALAADASQPVAELIEKIKSKDDNVRGAAWQGAGPLGAPAVKPLAGVMTAEELEVARSAKRALWKIVRHAGRPGADTERKAVAAQLVELLHDQPTPVKREALWMLSEIGGDAQVDAIGALLTDREVREDARAALERIPGNASVKMLERQLTVVPEEYRPAVAQSLRVRGVKVSGYPSQKLVPTRPKGPGAAKTA
jgi:HEAT repeat protein